MSDVYDDWYKWRNHLGTPVIPLRYVGMLAAVSRGSPMVDTNQRDFEWFVWP